MKENVWGPLTFHLAPPSDNKSLQQGSATTFVQGQFKLVLSNKKIYLVLIIGL